VRVPLPEIIDQFSIVSAEYLLEIVLTHVAVTLKVLNDQVDLFLCGIHLFGRTAQFQLCASGEYF